MSKILEFVYKICTPGITSDRPIIEGILLTEGNYATFIFNTLKKHSRIDDSQLDGMKTIVFEENYYNPPFRDTENLNFACVAKVDLGKSEIVEIIDYWLFNDETDRGREDLDSSLTYAVAKNTANRIADLLNKENNDSKITYITVAGIDIFWQ